MRKLVIGALAAASILGGSAAVAAVNPLVIAGAQNDPGTTTAPTTVPAPSTSGPTPSANGGDPAGKQRPRGQNPLQQTLDELVANGTITQAQADAITSSLKAKIADHKGPGGPGGPGGSGAPGAPGGRPGKGPGVGLVKKHLLETAATAIGIDAAALKTELGEGRSLAEVATAHGVDPQKVIDAIVAASTADIDAAVAAGKIPADRAATMKEKLAARVAEMVTKAHRGGKPGS